jgi:DNA-binding response OmpR family regulator
VRVASSGREVQSLGDDEVAGLQLLVTDVIMPGLNGREVAEELRRRRAGLPVLFISGYTQDAFVDEAVGEHSGFLAKPFTPSELVASVRAVLDATS